MAVLKNPQPRQIARMFFPLCEDSTRDFTFASTSRRPLALSARVGGPRDRSPWVAGGLGAGGSPPDANQK